jgi:hypothetical protein
MSRVAQRVLTEAGSICAAGSVGECFPPRLVQVQWALIITNEFYSGYINAKETQV